MNVVGWRVAFYGSEINVDSKQHLKRGLVFCFVLFSTVVVHACSMKLQNNDPHGRRMALGLFAEAEYLGRPMLAEFCAGFSHGLHVDQDVERNCDDFRANDCCQRHQSSVICRVRLLFSSPSSSMRGTAFSSLSPNCS